MGLQRYETSKTVLKPSSQIKSQFRKDNKKGSRNIDTIRIYQKKTLGTTHIRQSLRKNAASQEDRILGNGARYGGKEGRKSGCKQGRK